MNQQDQINIIYREPPENVSQSEPLPGVALAGDFFDKNDPLRVVTDPDEIAALIQRKKS